MKKTISLGFTLMELLVVISVIAVLVGLGTSSFATATKKSRDARRRSDVHDIAQAMEQYYSICSNVYPTPNAGGAVMTGNVSCTSPNINIMPTIPYDPQTTPYQCSACTGTAYRICADMETEASDFCVTNRQ